MIKKPLFSLLFCLFCSTSAQAASPGDEAPDCLTSDIEDNHPLHISDHRNKVVYLDFWASWCPPCKKSFPVLDRLHRELKAQNFEVIAVNLDENKDDALAFLQDNPVNFTVAYDGEGKCPEAYQVMAMPSSYIIDKNGVIRKVHLGFRGGSEAEIRATLLSLLNN